MKRQVGIYVYSTTVVAVNQSVELRQMGKPGSTKLGEKAELQKGIYNLIGDQNLVVSVGGSCDVTILEEKDPWPTATSERFIRAFGSNGTFDVNKLSDFFASVDRGL